MFGNGFDGTRRRWRKLACLTHTHTHTQQAQLQQLLMKPSNPRVRLNSHARRLSSITTVLPLLDSTPPPRLVPTLVLYVCFEFVFFCLLFMYSTIGYFTFAFNCAYTFAIWFFAINKSVNEWMSITFSWTFESLARYLKKSDFLFWFKLIWLFFLLLAEIQSFWNVLHAENHENVGWQTSDNFWKYKNMYNGLAFTLK